ncbi:MAG: hypothetical protein EP297_14490 [Gammaproteobacteria bacterium]|nr:MAG: hypothetical protein EP297_14490 [Gammaproteobacteria bacterium]
MSLLDEVVRHSQDANATDIFLKVGRPPFIHCPAGPICLSLPPINQNEIEEILELIKESDTRGWQSYDEKPRCLLVCRYKNEVAMRVEVFGADQALSLCIRLHPIAPMSLDKIGLPDGFKSQIETGGPGMMIISAPHRSGLTTTLTSIAQHYANQDLSSRIGFMSEEQGIGVKNNTPGLIKISPVTSDNEFSHMLKHAESFTMLIIDGVLSPIRFRRLLDFSANTQCLVIYGINVVTAIKLGSLSSVPACIDYCLDQIIKSLILSKNPAYNSDINQLTHASASKLAATLNGILCRDMLISSSHEAVPLYEYAAVTPAVRNLISENKIARIVEAIIVAPKKNGFTRNQHLYELVESGRIPSDEVKAHPMYGESFTREYQGKLKGEKDGRRI